MRGCVGLMVLALVALYSAVEAHYNNGWNGGWNGGWNNGWNSNNNRPSRFIRDLLKNCKDDSSASCTSEETETCCKNDSVSWFLFHRVHMQYMYIINEFNCKNFIIT